MKLITILGNLGVDATKTDKNYLYFTVGVSDDVDKTKTDWFRCFSDKLNLAQYLKKGKQVIIQGRLSFKENTYNKDNTMPNKIVNYVNVLSIDFIPGKKPNSNNNETENTVSIPVNTDLSLLKKKSNSDVAEFKFTDDLPF